MQLFSPVIIFLKISWLEKLKNAINECGSRSNCNSFIFVIILIPERSDVSMFYLSSHVNAEISVSYFWILFHVLWCYRICTLNNPCVLHYQCISKVELFILCLNKFLIICILKPQLYLYYISGRSYELVYIGATFKSVSICRTYHVGLIVLLLLINILIGFKIYIYTANKKEWKYTIIYFLLPLLPSH